MGLSCCRSVRDTEVVDNKEDGAQEHSNHRIDFLRKYASHDVSQVEKRDIDFVTNNRVNWKEGFAVEVFSETNAKWFKGQVVKSVGSGDNRLVTVVYNGTSKTLEVWSSHLRPLIRDSCTKSHHSFTELFGQANELMSQHAPKQKAEMLDIFLSHSQKDGQDAVRILSLLLQSQNIKTWVDMEEPEIDGDRIVKGVAESRCFGLFLTKDYFNRVWTIFELETAISLDKEIVVIWEGDERHGGYASLNSHIDACPKKYKALLFQREAIKFERRMPLQDTQIKVLAARILQCSTKNVI